MEDRPSAGVGEGFGSVGAWGEMDKLSHRERAIGPRGDPEANGGIASGASALAVTTLIYV
jgi:histidine ammonia-lyase